MSATWVGRWRVGHAWIAGGATLFVAGWCAAFGAPPLSTQLIWLALIAIPTALPHGAVDHLAGRRLFRGRWWFVWFGGAYLAVAGAVVAIWLAAPRLSLIAFLSLSVLHFGAGDSNRRDRVLRGLIPVGGPIMFWPEETARIFSWLLFDGSSLPSLAALGPYALAAWGALAAWYTMRREWSVALEVASLALLVMYAPPLVSFGVYFCGWHSFRHGLEQAGALAPEGPGRGFATYLREAWPLTLATAAGGLAAFALLPGSSEALAAVFFVGLAALTVPHMLVHGWARSAT